MEVELFFSGTGQMEKNKLYISYPSAIIDKEDSGEIISCIGIGKDSVGNIGPVLSFDRSGCNETGICAFLSEGNFLSKPTKPDSPTPQGGIPMIMSESKLAKYAPLLLKLNTNKKAPSGDFDIRLVFTYVSGDEVDTSYETVKVHITSWSDRHSKSATIIGIIVAVAGSVIAAVTLLR